MVVRGHHDPGLFPLSFSHFLYTYLNVLSLCCQLIASRPYDGCCSIQDNRWSIKPIDEADYYFFGGGQILCTLLNHRFLCSTELVNVELRALLIIQAHGTPECEIENTPSTMLLEPGFPNDRLSLVSNSNHPVYMLAEAYVWPALSEQPSAGTRCSFVDNYIELRLYLCSPTKAHNFCFLSFTSISADHPTRESGSSLSMNELSFSLPFAVRNCPQNAMPRCCRHHRTVLCLY